MTSQPDCPMVCIRNPYAENGLFLAAMFETNPLVWNDINFEMSHKAIPNEIFVDLVSFNDTINLAKEGSKVSYKEALISNVRLTLHRYLYHFKFDKDCINLLKIRFEKYDPDITTFLSEIPDPTLEFINSYMEAE